jgi:hypothetical protein
MNKLLIVFLGVWLAPTLAVGQFTSEANGTATPTKMTTTQQEVQAAMDAVTRAIKTKDKALYERYVAPNYIHTNPGGEVTSRSRAQEFSDMTSGVQTFSSIEPVPLAYDQIRIFNDNTAVITAHFKVSGNDHGQNFTMQARSLATWVKRNDAWQMVAFQATGVAKPFQK